MPRRLKLEVPYPIGDRLKKARKHCGWSQSELARRIGIHAMYISKLETGVRHEISGTLLCLLAPELKVSAGYLLGLEPDTLPDPPHKEAGRRSRGVAKSS